MPVFRTAEGVEETRKGDIMSDQEKAALLAAGEKCLTFLEKGMNEAAQGKDGTLARCYQLKYDGAAYMLEALCLISHEEYRARHRAVFARYLEALFPESNPKEAAE